MLIKSESIRNITYNELKVYMYLTENHIDSIFDFNKSSAISIEDCYLVGYQQSKIALASLVNKGLVLKIKRGQYIVNKSKLNITN